jgi:uncharacterized RDD family membrane protein YckC
MRQNLNGIDRRAFVRFALKSLGKQSNLKDMPIQKPPQNQSGGNEEKLSPLQRYLEKKKKTEAASLASSGKLSGTPSVKPSGEKAEAKSGAKSHNGTAGNGGGRLAFKSASPAAASAAVSIGDIEAERRALEQGVPLAPPSAATMAAATAVSPTVAAAAIVAESGVKEVDLASFGARFIAVVIDAAIIRCLQLVLQSAIASTFGVLPSSLYGFIEWPLNKFALLALLYFYFGWFYSEKGATPGKLLLNLQVVQSETGEKLTYIRAFLRETLGKMISMALLGLGFLIAAFRNDHRALHDMIFDTRVIEKPK